MKKDAHYRLPMKKVINSYIWADMTKPEKAILPVVGCYVNPYNKWACSLIHSEIAEYTGYSNTYQAVSKPLEKLFNRDLIITEKARRHNKYYLTALSYCEKWTSFFPLYRYQIEGGYWAKLKPCEKAVYPILYVKGIIKHPDIVDFPEICCRGWIKKKKDFCKWTGLNYSSFKRTLRGLEEISLLDIDGDGNYDLYKLEMMMIKK